MEATGMLAVMAAAALAGGLAFEESWLLAFAGVFLAEEIYETSVLALIVRAGDRVNAPAA
jgi:hypothetical protein